MRNKSYAVVVFLILLLSSYYQSVYIEASESLLRKYEPILYLYPKDEDDEEYLPMDVEDYVRECSLRDATWEWDDIVLKEGTIGLSDLGTNPNHSDGNKYLKFVENSDKPDFRDVLDTVNNGEKIREFAAAAWQEYAPIKDHKIKYYGRQISDDGYIVLQYWFFYAYNSWGKYDAGFNVHEGDWECIAIFLHLGTLQPLYVAYSAHYDSGEKIRRQWSDMEDGKNRIGNHPIVYVALGSHANYFDSGVHDIEVFGFPFADNTFPNGRHIGPGQEKECIPWNTPFILEDETHQLPLWASSYQGKWGIDSFNPGKSGWGFDGPRFPASQLDDGNWDKWYHPARWANVPPLIPLTVSGSSLSPTTITPGQQNIDIESLSFNLTGAADTLIIGIEVDLIGTATDSDIAQAKLIYNSQVIDTATFSNKKLTFTLNNYIIELYSGLELKIAFDISSSATAGHTLGVQLADPSYIHVLDPAIVVSSTNFPIKSGYSTIQSEPSPKPDLAVTSVNTLNSAKPGDYIAASFTVKNQGDVPSGSFHNRIFLATTRWGTDTLLGKYPMDSISAGYSLSDTQTIQIPNDVPPGDYYVTVYAEEIDELRVDNNIGSTWPDMISIEPTSLPDLIVSDIQTTPNPPPIGGLTTIGIQIKNQGAGDAIETFLLEFYFDDTYKGHVYINGLVAQATRTSYWQAQRWPSDTNSHTIKGVVDPDNVISESTIENNELSKSFLAIKQDTTSPQVSIGAPNGGENWVVGTQQTIRWNATDNIGVDHIDIQFSADDGANWSSIAMGIPNSGQHNWTPGTISNTCRIKVIAYDTAGNSGFDISGVFAIIQSCPKLPAPTLYNPVVSEDNYTISWSDVGGANSYVLQEDTDASFPNTTEYFLNQTSKFFSDKPVNTYYYRVCAVNECGRGNWSNTKSVTVLGRQWPGEITNRSPSDGADNQPLTVTLSWQCIHPAGEVTRYDVWFAPHEVTTFYSHHLVSSQQLETTYTAYNLPYNTTCSWKIDAIDETGDERTSSVFYFTTIADNSPPTGSIVINNNAATTDSYTVTLNLSASDAGESGVEYMQFSNDGGSWTKWIPYSAHYPWNLADSMYGGRTGLTIYTVYAQFRDVESNISPTYSDTIEKIEGTPGNIILNGVCYATIRDAMDAAQSGDTIYLTEGIYTIIGKNSPPRYPSHSVGIVMKPDVTLMGAGAKNTKLILEGGLYTIIDADNALIQGLTIINSDPGGVRYAVLLESDSSKIRYCIIENTYRGIKIDGGVNNEISNNVIANNGWGVWLNGSNVKIYNNTIAKNNNGIVGEEGIIKNNIIAFNNSYGVSLPASAIFQYNDVFGNGTDYDIPDLHNQAGNISADPRFINADAGNYRLRTDSPCINRGTNVGIPANGTPDMGDFEYNGTGTLRVESNLPEASFAITGPQNFIASGTNWSQPNVLIGIYSITFKPVANYYMPHYASKVLESNQTLVFDGNYELDTNAPQVTISVNYDEHATANKIVDIVLSASDDVVGMGDMQFSNDGVSWSPPEPYSSLRKEWDLGSYGGSSSSGMKTVYAKVSDALENPTTTTDDILYVPNRRILAVPDEFQTIQVAVNAAQEGDMVWVAPGTYHESVVLKEGIRLQGSGPALTILQSRPYTITAADNCVIDGFTLNNKNEGHAGVSCDNASPIISNNIIYGVETVQVSGNSSPRIRNNIIHNISLMGKGVFISGGASAIIENNTIVNSKEGIYLTGATAQTRVYVVNNIIANNSGWGIEDNSSEKEHIHIFASYNCFWNNGNGNFGGTNSDKISSIADIDANPMFVDPDNEDFNLQVNSPCVNSGNPEAKYNDLDGTPNDRGAYGGPSVNTYPNAHFTVDSQLGGISKEFSFDASLSTDRESDKLSFRWDWESNGAFDTQFSFDRTATHKYTSTGEKTITLQIRDEGGFVGSTSKTVTVINQPPNTPHTPNPSDGAEKQSVNIQLSWQGDDPDTGDTVTYDVYFGASGNPPLVSEAPQTETTYNPGVLDYHKFYYWKVVAHDSHNASATSPIWSFLTGTEPAPAAPSNLSASPISHDQVNLTWTDNSSNELGFKVERKTGTNGAYIQISEVGANVISYTDTNLSPNTTYFYQIRGFNNTGHSAYSNEVSASTSLLYGDINNDGNITAYDAILILRYGVGIATLTETQRDVADVSNDGTISAYDVALILLRIVGLISKFPVEESPSAAPQPSIAKVAGYRLQLNEVLYKPGMTFTVSIILDGASNIFAGEIGLKYNPSLLTPLEVKTTSGYFLKYEPDNGQLRVWIAGTEAFEGNGSIIEATFKLSENVAAPVRSHLSLSKFKLNETTFDKTELAEFTIQPYQFKLLSNYPNPFNPDTWIPYELAEEAEVAIEIYNLAGQLIRTLDLGLHPRGTYYSKSKAAHWDGCNNAGERVASGVYFYYLHAGSFRATKKMVIVR